MSLELSPREADRLAQTVALIPPDATSGLEIGFRDFRGTEHLAGRLKLVSIDLPHAVAGRPPFRLVFGDIQNLPFRASSFDIVVCTEVLEHLSDAVLTHAVAELRRVSRRYILVSVPDRQKLQNGLFKCAQCFTVAHSMGHIQSFDEARLRRLFGGLILEKVISVGSAPGYGPDWLYRAANRIGGSWNRHTETCPVCGSSGEAPTPNAVGRLLRRAIWRSERIAGSRPAWIVTLFRLDQ
jgi:hypothetical protein